MENGTFLRFYVEEGQRHHGVLLWEWLLEQACGLNIRGGSAFQAIGGFGRHRLLHENRFLELAGSVVVEVEFIVDDAEAERLQEIVSGKWLAAPILLAQLVVQRNRLRPHRQRLLGQQIGRASCRERV